jgi:MFS family permease
MFLPPDLRSVSGRAFRFHLAYTLLDAVYSGIMANTPVMAIKAMHATDAQLQLPVAMASIGIFTSVFTGVTMAGRRKQPFVTMPGVAMGLSTLIMAWMHSAWWFLALSGMISIFDFSLRPAIPSIIRSVYPEHCRAHVSGTLRQYAAAVFLVSSLSFALLLTYSPDVWPMMRLQLSVGGVLSLLSFLCFRKLPRHGDGSHAESENSVGLVGVKWKDWPMLAPFRDALFSRYLAAFFVFATFNLFYAGIIAPVFTHDLGYGYAGATMLIHIVPAIGALVVGGRFAARFDGTTIWKSFAAVTFLWAIDPLVLAIFPTSLPLVVIARLIRGPATVGSLVLSYYTGVHSFARPGRDTSCYMASMFLINGLARLLGPIGVAFLSGRLSHRGILLSGGAGVMLASAMFFAFDPGRKDLGTLREPISVNKASEPSPEGPIEARKSVDGE